LTRLTTKPAASRPGSGFSASETRDGHTCTSRRSASASRRSSLTSHSRPRGMAMSLTTTVRRPVRSAGAELSRAPVAVRDLSAARDEARSRTAPVVSSSSSTTRLPRAYQIPGDNGGRGYGATRRSRRREFLVRRREAACRALNPWTAPDPTSGKGLGCGRAGRPIQRIAPYSASYTAGLDKDVACDSRPLRELKLGDITAYAGSASALQVNSMRHGRRVRCSSAGTWGGGAPRASPIVSWCPGASLVAGRSELCLCCSPAIPAVVVADRVDLGDNCSRSPASRLGGAPPVGALRSRRSLSGESGRPR